MYTLSWITTEIDLVLITQKSSIDIKVEVFPRTNGNCWSKDWEE